MARPVWSGMVTFGLVSIPVRLLPAVRDRTVHFAQFHEKDGGRIHYKRFCEKEDREVAYEDIARGYEVSSGRFVMFDRDELDRLEPRRTRGIDVDQFVEIGEIDPIYYDTTYYLAPDKGGEGPYRLLLRAMADAGRIAIGKFVMREKEHVVAIRPSGDALVLQTLFYADEVVRQEDAVDAGGGKVDQRQLRLARQLIDNLAQPLDLGEYEDEFREKVAALARRKSAGRKAELAEEPEEPAKVVDLMDALRQSVESASRPRRSRGRTTPSRSASTRTRRRKSA